MYKHWIIKYNTYISEFMNCVLPQRSISIISVQAPYEFDMKHLYQLNTADDLPISISDLMKWSLSSQRASFKCFWNVHIKIIKLDISRIIFKSILLIVNLLSFNIFNTITNSVTIRYHHKMVFTVKFKHFIIIYNHLLFPLYIFFFPIEWFVLKLFSLYNLFITIQLHAL